jgi:DNA-binding IclR family transcriptional regulator
MSTATATASTTGKESSLHLIRKMREIMFCFLPDNPGLTLAHVHRQTGLPTSTALRILRSLVSEEFLVHDGERYRLSKGMVRWAAAVGDESLDLRRISSPHLADLSEATGHPALLYVEDGDAAVCVAGAESGAVTDRFTGDSYPLVLTPAGKLLLAHHHDGVHRVMRSGWPSIDDLTQRAEIMRRVSGDFDRVRRRGSLVQRCKRTGQDLWLCSGIVDQNGATKGVVVTRMPTLDPIPHAELSALAHHVRTAAERVSVELIRNVTSALPMDDGSGRDVATGRHELDPVGLTAAP